MSDWMYLLTMTQRPTPLSVGALYGAFALVSTGANIATQHLVVLAYGGPLQAPAYLVCGTGAGLVVKYLLDANFIFRFKTRDLVHTGQTFSAYSLMGVVTTLVFWSVELAFQAVFHTEAMRYVGACVGLTIGYALKYQLDKRFVFRARA
jgi:putative flippase GtrA